MSLDAVHQCEDTDRQKLEKVSAKLEGPIDLWDVALVLKKHIFVGGVCQRSPNHYVKPTTIVWVKLVGI